MHADPKGPGTAAGATAAGAPASRQGPISMPADEAVERAAASLRLLGDPTRMKLLWALAQGASNVSRLAELVGAAPATVSQHLAKLRLAGLVRARRRGAFVYYSAADAHVTGLVAGALDHAAHGPTGEVPA